MGTECQKDYTDDEKQLAEEAEARFQQIGIDDRCWAEIQKEMPAIEAGRETKCVELLQQHSKDSQERINEARTLSTNGSREEKEEWVQKLEILDHGRWPSDKESRETVRAGLKLEINEWSCTSLPPITGFGVKDMQPHINETIKVLSQNEKLWEYRQLWAEPLANKILFADREALRKEGIEIPEDVGGTMLGAQALIADKDLPLTILVFNDPITGEFPKGDALLRILAHETAHGNEVQFQGSSMGWFKPVAVSQENDPSIWGDAIEAQLQKGFVSETSQMSLSDEEREAANFDPALAAELMANPEKGNRHFVHELFVAWVMDSPNLCDEMRQFFDEYMPKAFDE